MANIGYATLSVIGSMKGFSKSISPEMDRAGADGAKRFGAAMASSSKSIGGGAGKILGVGILSGLTLAVAGVGAVLKTGFGEAMDASAGTAQLAAGIKSTGNAAGVSVKGLNALASSIQGYSGQTDDSIVASEKLLLTFTNIKNQGPNKIFDMATAATADMAAKMGGDASGAAIQLGKALNDPVKGISALSRVGVSFTQGQKDSIAAMVKHGDVAGAQSIILKELTTEFGGAAKAAGTSLPGQLAIAKRSFEDVSQSVVEGLIPVVMPAITNIATTITTMVIPAMQSFIQGFKDGTGAGGTFRDILSTVGGVLSTVGGFIKDHTSAFIALAGAIGVGVVAVKAYQVAQAVSLIMLKAQTAGTLEYKIVQLAMAAGAGIATAAQWLFNAALTANPIGLVVAAVGLLVGGIVLIATKTTWFQTIWKTMTDALSTAWQWMWNSILAPVIRFVLGGFASITEGIAKMLGVLANIPGFGWAKVAADKMSGAADKARALANGILDIPNEKHVNIWVNTVYSKSGINPATGLPVGFASGTNFAPGGMALVGERGPEIVNLPRGSQVIPNSFFDSGRSSGNGGSGGSNAEVVSAIEALGDRLGNRFGAELDRQARTIQTMQRQMA